MQIQLGRELASDEVVHHRNGNTLDNRVDNLELMSLSEHSRLHMIGNTNGTDNIPPILCGSSNGRARLNEDDVAQIKNSLAVGQTQVALGIEYGVDRTTIRSIANGETWQHI